MSTIAIKHKLRSGQVTIGSWMQFPNASVAEIMGSLGYDWIGIDLEHSHFDLENLCHVIRALEVSGSVPLARVAQNEPIGIKQALEAGARGIILPMIETAQGLLQAVECIKYPPEGKRGVGFSRANLFGRNFSSHISRFNEEILIVAQIESNAALESLEEILSIKQIDAIMVGPYDLSASLGITGDFEHKNFLLAMDFIKKKCIEHSVPYGAHVVHPDPVQLHRRVEEGYQWIAYGVDAVFLYSGAECPVVRGQ